MTYALRLPSTHDENWTSADKGWADYCAAGAGGCYLSWSIAAYPDLEHAAHSLLISSEWTHDSQRLMPLDVRPLESELARLSADFSPAAGADGPIALLGHVVDYLTMSDPDHRSLMVHAIAAHLFHSGSYKEKPLYRFWLRSKPKVDVPFREAVAKLSRVPIGLWRVESVESEGAWLEDLWVSGLVFNPMGRFLSKLGHCVWGRWFWREWPWEIHSGWLCMLLSECPPHPST